MRKKVFKIQILDRISNTTKEVEAPLTYYKIIFQKTQHCENVFLALMTNCPFANISE